MSEKKNRINTRKSGLCRVDLRLLNMYLQIQYFEAKCLNIAVCDLQSLLLLSGNMFNICDMIVFNSDICFNRARIEHARMVSIL